MPAETFREWRFGVFSANALHACKGRISWAEKRAILAAPPCPFSLKGLYKVIFADPTHVYTLIKAFFKPTRIDRGPAGCITEVEGEFFHRKD